MNLITLIYDLLSVLGALAFFLFGMKLMSEALQKIAGVKMRQYLSAITANRWRGLATGFAITGILQSSSAATVLLVGFVNAGLITVLDSIGLILGANIGTTVTSWLITFFGYSFNIRVIILPLIALAIPLYFGSSSNRKSVAEFVLGFAILFIGLQFLRDVLPDIHRETGIVEFLKANADTNFISFLIAALIGIGITILIQSSTATITLTIVLLSEGMVSFEMAAALIVGENIGTTATANIAAIVANRNAKRTALIHFLFNLIGALLIIPVFNYAIQLIDWLADMILRLSDNDVLLTAPLKVSLFHSLFNITNALILTWFTKPLQRLSTVIIPIKENEEDGRMLSLQENFVTPVSELSLVHLSKEISKMARLSQKMFDLIPQLLMEKNPDEYQILNDKIRQMEQQMDQNEQILMNYLARLTESKLSTESSKLVNGSMIIVNNIENIADICFKIARVIELKNSQKAWFNQQQRDRLRQMFETVTESLNLMLTNLSKPQKPDLITANQIENRLNELKTEYIETHLSDLKAGNYPFNSGNFYQQLVVYSEKIGDHAISVSETLNRSY
jgi:phosphate:Na+ symporter